MFYATRPANPVSGSYWRLVEGRRLSSSFWMASSRRLLLLPVSSSVQLFDELSVCGDAVTCGVSSRGHPQPIFEWLGWRFGPGLLHSVVIVGQRLSLEPIFLQFLGVVGRSARVEVESLRFEGAILWYAFFADPSTLQLRLLVHFPE